MIPPTFGKRKPVNFESTIQKVVHVSLDPPKSTFFRKLYFSSRGTDLWKFLHTLEFDQGLLEHTTNRVESPKILRVNIKNSAQNWALTPISNFGDSGSNLTKLYQGT